jgi:hypothetical protein
VLSKSCAPFNVPAEITEVDLAYQRFTDVVVGDAEELRIAQTAIRCRDLDQIDVVVIRVGGILEVGSGVERQGAGSGIDGEQCRVRAAGDA